ncbi:flap endonuclease Xni [Candidatus Spongiihabitans sp.]|uniref:flap endonuclease Xni n=1 Tax=Candidatus Spongiihabitans sp. TaxID=3101308 RepID=UPI003C6F73E3
MKALLVDGLNLVRRIYAAVPNNPEQRSAQDADANSDVGHINNVIRSACASLHRALKKHNPSHCLAVFEQSGKNWRHKLFPDYKKDRSPMPAALHSAMADFESAFSDLGVRTFSLPGHKADDVIATLANKIALRGGHVVILSTDRILCQLLNSWIRVYDHFADHYLDSEMIKKKFQVKPEQIPHLLALAGDSSLSITGIKSIGIRTASRLINDHGNLEKVLATADNMPGKLGSKLYSGKEDARLAYKLFTLKTDIELGVNLSQFRYSATTESQ